MEASCVCCMPLVGGQLCVLYAIGWRPAVCTVCHRLEASCVDGTRLAGRAGELGMHLLVVGRWAGTWWCWGSLRKCAAALPPQRPSLGGVGALRGLSECALPPQVLPVLGIDRRGRAAHYPLPNAGAAGRCAGRARRRRPPPSLRRRRQAPGRGSAARLRPRATRPSRAAC